MGCQRVRNYQTSHCWNHLCGRWAYKAITRAVDLGVNNNDIHDDDDDGLNVGLAAAAARGGEEVAGRRARCHQWIARLNHIY